MNDADKKEVQKITREALKGSFSDRRIGDTPTDAFQLTPRKYVNMNGTISSRPASVLAIIGQQYFATDLNKPIFYDGTKWRDATSSVVASN